VSGGNIYVANQGKGTIDEYTTAAATVNASLRTLPSQKVDDPPPDPENLSGFRCIYIRNYFGACCKSFVASC
jgi:hypothetical protein